MKGHHDTVDPIWNKIDTIKVTKSLGGYSATKKGSSVEERMCSKAEGPPGSRRYATPKQPLYNRETEDLLQLHRSLGSRHEQLLKIALVENFDPLVYSAKDLANDIRSILQQIGDAIPSINGYIRLLKMKYGNGNGNGNVTSILYEGDKSYISLSDLFELKMFARRLVHSELCLKLREPLDRGL